MVTEGIQVSGECIGETQTLPFYDDGWAQIWKGNALDILKGFPSESVQCVVTSPPYWGLRKYEGEQDFIWGGTPDCVHEWGPPLPPGNSNYCQLCGAWRGAYGLEPGISEYIEHTLFFLREIKRVLRKDGVVFWNIGDSYSSSGAGGNRPSDKYHGHRERAGTRVPRFNPPLGIKRKELCLIPFRVAIAAQEEGWYVRSVIIWNKRQPMPESVNDRPTISHEYILMFSRSRKYYWDKEAVREKTSGGAHHRGNGVNPKARGPFPAGWDSGPGSHNKLIGRYPHPRQNESYSASITNLVSSRNIRTVWDLGTEQFSGAHFAPFPSELPRKCILAATSEKGNCSKCGKPWVRVLETQKTLPIIDYGGKNLSQDSHSRTRRLLGNERAWRESGGMHDNPFPAPLTLGWKPQCSCNAGVVPSLVMDIFGGTGTSGMVAKQLGRRSVVIDSSENYCRLALKRIGDVPLPLPLEAREYEFVST